MTIFIDTCSSIDTTFESILHLYSCNSNICNQFNSLTKISTASTGSCSNSYSGGNKLSISLTANQAYILRLRGSGGATSNGITLTISTGPRKYITDLHSSLVNDSFLQLIVNVVVRCICVVIELFSFFHSFQ